MATIKSGILGKFNGSVGNITGYNLGGQQVIRKKSVDVARQWCGELGKTENCQVGVFSAYQKQRREKLVSVAVASL